jgi:hypothetical protein
VIRINLIQDVWGKCVPTDQCSRHRGDFVVNLLHDINIFFDFYEGAPLEFLPFIEATKFAFVPGTVAGKAEKKAVSLTRRPNGTYLKPTAIGHPSLCELEKQALTAWTGPFS